ncbi:MAG: MFS transporter [Patescibacteria group bacterium]
MSANLSTNIFKNSAFVKLWSAQVLAHPAGHILTFILLIKVYNLSQSSFAVSLLLGLSVLPPILFSAIGGVMADSYSRKRLLIVTNILRGFLVLGFIWCSDSLVAIFLIIFLNTTITQFYLPAESAAIPKVVKRHQIFLANSFFMFVLYVSFLIGYSLAGPALHYLGETNTYILLIAMYWLASLLDFFLPPLKAEKIKHQWTWQFKKSFRFIKDSLQESTRFIKGNKIIIFIGLQLLFVFAIQRSIVALLPQLAEKVLFFDVKQISYYLIMPIAAGALVGGVLSNKLKSVFSKRNLIIIGILLDSIFLIFFPFTHFVRDGTVIDPILAQNLMISLIFFLVFISGLANVLIIISAQTYIHEQSEDVLRGRMFGNFYTLMNVLIFPTVILVGWSASNFSLDSVILVMGLTTLLVAVSVWRIGRRYFDHI